MKIAFLVDDFPALSQTFILHQITGMIDRGHSINIYANKVGHIAKVHPEVESYKLLDKTFYFQMPDNHLIRLINALRFILAKGWKNPIACLRSLNIFQYGREAASLQLLYFISRFIGVQPDDIIHCQLGFIGLQGLLFRDIGALKGKLIVSFRGADLSFYLKMFGNNFYERLFENAEIFLPVSDSMKCQLIELGCEPNKIIVHRSGIDVAGFDFYPRELKLNETIHLVTIARLVEKKGVEYGIRAVAKLVKLHPNIEYQIVGDGPLMSDLEQLIDRLKLNTQVKLIGWKQREEIVKILDSAHILLAPSVTSSDGDKEGIPNVLKEAMARGLPVISTQHSGIPELVQDGISGFLVPERDVDALADKLEYLIRHPESWANMGSAGRAFVQENYDINKLNDRLEEIYQQLLFSE